MGLRHKLLLGLALLIVPNLFVLIYGINQFQKVNHRLDRINSSLMPSLRNLQKLHWEIYIAHQLMDLSFYKNLESVGFPEPWQKQLVGIQDLLHKIESEHPTAQSMIPRIRKLHDYVKNHETKSLLEELPLLVRWFEREVSMETLLTQKGLQESTNQLFVNLGFSVALSLLLFGIASHHLKRLRKLLDAIKNVALGRFQLLIGGPAHHQISKDEIVTLAREFNHMVVQLERRESTLREQHSALEVAQKQNQHREQILHALILFLDQTLNHIPMVIQVFNQDLTLLFENEAARTLHANTLYELLGFFEAEDELLQSFDSLIENSEASHLGLFAERGSQAHWELRASSITGFGSEGKFLLVIAIDRTTEVATEQQLAQNEKLVTMGRLSAQVAHEIRNPLNAMGLNLQLLSELVEHPEAARMIHLLTTEIHRLDRLTSSYLEASRLRDSQRLRSSSQRPMTVNAVFENVKLLFQESARHQSIELRIQTEANLGSRHVDSDHLMPVLINLVRNSFNAIHENGTIEMGLSECPTGLMFWIEDSGPGIPQEVRSSVQTSFFSTDPQGTGLGFTIIQEHLEKLHGEFRIMDPLRLSGVRIECRIGDTVHDNQEENPRC